METPNKEIVDQELLARFAKALGHPTRVAIVQFLIKQKECYFGRIWEELPIAKATVSQHLKELKDAGIIQGEIDGPRVKYCINKNNWKLMRVLFNNFASQTLVLCCSLTFCLMSFPICINGCCFIVIAIDNKQSNYFNYYICLSPKGEHHL